MDLKYLENEFNNIEKKINEHNGIITEKEKYIKTKENEIIKLEKNKKDNLDKKIIIKKACKQARQLSEDTFAAISTRALQTILGDNLEVKIIEGEKNNVPTADFKVIAKYSDYETETDPTEEDGGGVADIVSLTNFLTMNILNQRTNSAPIILDEPTKFVSAGHADNVAIFLEQFSKDFNKQIIMVTHAQETKKYANKVFKIEMNENGYSEISDETINNENNNE